MSNDHLDTIQPTPLMTAYHAARRKRGKKAADLCVAANGGIAGASLSSVPESNVAKLIAALERLAREGAPADSKASAADPFDAIRSKAFGAPRETRKPAATFESLADDAFAKFNNPPRNARDGD